ncbi:hypothetical protein K438DRAFT_1763460 [Mycena galopus ATCC 62051]|nr:hypothetical protein K438DRAFT_1763460 [Mycena galopus ATCC 62051]
MFSVRSLALIVALAAGVRATCPGEGIGVGMLSLCITGTVNVQECSDTGIILQPLRTFAADIWAELYNANSPCGSGYTGGAWVTCDGAIVVSVNPPAEGTGSCTTAGRYSTSRTCLAKNEFTDTAGGSEMRNSIPEYAYFVPQRSVVVQETEQRERVSGLNSSTLPRFMSVNEDKDRSVRPMDQVMILSTSATALDAVLSQDAGVRFAAVQNNSHCAVLMPFIEQVIPGVKGSGKIEVEATTPRTARTKMRTDRCNFLESTRTPEAEEPLY